MTDTTNSTSSGSSQSSTTPVQTEENNIINQISGVASGMASQLYNWAQGVYAQTSAITNQAVGNFFQVSQNMLGLSNNMIDQYNSLFAPENARLVADANSYASPAREAADMGMAGSTAAQAGQAAEQNSIAQLQQYGIDPSSGRYASLINADNVQNAANVAGAENTQRVADTQMGQQLQAEAVQTGAQLPSSIANVENTGIQANTGAVNAELANANTGVNLFGLPNNYLNTAMQVKMPFNQQVAHSSQGSQSNGNKQQPTPNQPSNNGVPGSGAGGNAGSGGYNGMMTNPGPSVSGNPYGAAGTYSLGDMYGQDSIGGVNASDFTGGNIYNPDPNAGQDLGLGDGSTSGNMNIGQAGSADTGIQDLNNPFNDSGFGDTYNSGAQDATFGDMGGGTNTEFGNISYDPSANQASLPDGWDSSSVQTDYSNPDQSDQAAISSAEDQAQQDQQQDDEQDASDNTDYSSGDSGGGDYSGGGYARGGAIPAQPLRPPPMGASGPGMSGGGIGLSGPRPIPASGRMVPRTMSPSGGRQVDDVRARGPGNAAMRLNANEFVIPQDVALWKGQEFFQNLINDSRKKRMNPASAPAKPSQRPMGAH